MSVPFRWRLAGWVRRLPEFRGRDRLFLMARGDGPAAPGQIAGVFGDGLRFQADPSEDGSLAELYFLQYENPCLAPVLDAALGPGDMFVDVGANIGVYSGWASRRVGTKGAVQAFEPVPSTRALLERFIGLNGLENIRVMPSAVGSTPGTLELRLVPGASGLASAVGPAEGAPLRVPVTTLDDSIAASGGQVPRLIKIDVEGFEFEVLKGASRLFSGALGSPPPAVVFETQGEMLARAGAGFGELVSWMGRTAGYEVHALTTRGLVRYHGGDPRPVSTNALGLHPAHHAGLFRALERRRFRRNQTC